MVYYVGHSKIWNTYVSGYEKIRDGGSWKHMLVVRFEDVVMKTDEVVKALALLLGVQVNAHGNMGILSHGRAHFY